MWSQLKRLIGLLKASEQRQLFWLLAAIILMGLIDVLGISSILPFMAVVANPEVIYSNSFLHQVFSALDFSSPNTFLIFLGAVALGMMLLSNAVSLTVSTAILRFSYQLGHALSMRMLSGYLRQPYVFFLERNSSNLVLSSTDEAAHLIHGVVVPSLMAVAKLVVAVCILLLVVWVNPWLAVSFGMVIGGAYAVVFLFVRRKVASLGKDSQDANRIRFRLATEVFSGIKELKILGRDDAYQRQFSFYSARYSRNQWISAAVGMVPRYAIESIAFGSLLLLVIYLLLTQKAIGQALPLMVLYAFTAYRLLPAFQQLFASATQIRFNWGSLEVIDKEIKSFVGGELRVERPKISLSEELLPFRNSIELKSITFQYPGSREPVLSDFSLTIRRNSTVGLVGSTGAGKTTIVDIILGLLDPQSGHLLIDEIAVTSENVRAWQHRLGYVPQQIYLCDESVAANIAFGMQPEEIDMSRVEHAARIAKLHGFVIGELPEGYGTIIGERGVRLSGGQRQRIGIARALYTDPDVLILDEATSALDGITEDSVTEAIRTLSHEKTIITIAHRLSTVQECDIIYLLEDGRIVDQGTYQELLDRSVVFRAMAKVKD